MTFSRSATAMYLALVFASGAVVGVLGHKFYNAREVNATSRPQPDEWRRKYMDEMQTRLNLSSDQKLRLNILLDETRSRVREAQARAKPEIDQIKAEQVEKIRSMLDEKQRVEYNKLRKEREERAKQQKDSGRGL